MSRDVREWLGGLGLERYADAFEANALHLDLLTDLSDADLKDLGVSAMGHRKEILRAITTLSATREADGSDLPAGEGGTTSISVAGPERRQLTVMFCDLVGSTALSEQLDPEDLRNVISAFQDTCAGQVSRFDGFIARYMGDGLLVYFGYPYAHEDDPERAIRAGLGIVEAIGALDGNIGATTSIRIGIATGLVVAGDIIGEGASEERAVLGETPNLAARLQSLAEPDTVVISEATKELVEGLFDCRDLGAQTVKGISEPILPYRVAGESIVVDRFEATAVRGLTRLVGRDEEIGLLTKCWRQADEGEGQVLLLTAEAGIGKSRILRAFRDRLEGEDHSRVLFYCSPYHQSSAFYPAINQLERAARFETADGPESRLDKLEAVLRNLDLQVAEFAPVLANLLALYGDERYPALSLPPPQLRIQTLETLIVLTEAMAGRQPVLVVLEDAHWIDPSTLEMVNMAIDRIRGHRIFMVVTARPEFTPTWGAHPNLTTLALNRLSRRECGEMVTKVTGGKPLPQEIVDQIVDKTDGVPLFVEELTKTVVESGLLDDQGDRYAFEGHLPELAIPSSLKDSLMARLDRLADAKEIAQLAAAIGRTFGHELLAAVSQLDEDALDDALAQLMDAGLLYRRGLPPHATYEFKHALVRDAAYDSLLLSRRKEFHLAIAGVLVEQFSDLGQPEIVAQHYGEAGDAENAIEYWLLAGHQAAQRSAAQEAIFHLEAGIALIGSLTESQDRDRKELALRIALTTPIMTAEGFTSPNLVRNVERSMELSHGIGDTPEIFPVLYGRWVYSYTGGQVTAGLQIAREISELAARQNSEVPRMVGHRTTGVTSLALGLVTDATRKLEAGIELYEFDRHQPLANVYGMDFRSVGLSYLSVANWLSGFPEKAAARVRDAVDHAEKVDHPNSLGHALAISKGTVATFNRNADELSEAAERMVALAAEHHLPQWALFSAVFAAGAHVVRENFDEAIVAIQDIIEKMRAVPIGVNLTICYAFLAESQLNVGDLNGALHSLSAAEKIVSGGGERIFASEIQRLKGNAHLSNSDRNAAAAAFESAARVAASQGALPLELRAVMDLAGLQQDEGQNTEAREVVSPVYDRFTEGFDTPDLVAASVLLDELS